ncbi:hypothetical protein [Acidisoma sp. 7E03]
MGKLTRLPTEADWDAIGRRLLDAAAGFLAEAAATRAGVPRAALHVECHDGAEARIVATAPAVVAREQGAPGRPPESLLAPRAADLTILRNQLIQILRGEEA